MCMCTYLYISIYMCVHMYVYICTYINKHTCIRTYIHLYIDVCVCVCVYVCTHIHRCKVRPENSVRLVMAVHELDTYINVQFVRRAHYFWWRRGRLIFVGRQSCTGSKIYDPVSHLRYVWWNTLQPTVTHYNTDKAAMEAKSMTSLPSPVRVMKYTATHCDTLQHW